MSLDGRLSISGDAPPNQEKKGGWTSAEDKDYLKKIIDSADVLIMGRKTAEISPDFKKTVAIISKGGNILTRQTGSVGIVRPQLDEILQLLDMQIGEGAQARFVVMGGAQTYALFLQHRLVDMIRLTLEPAVLQTGPAMGFNGLFNTNATVDKFKMIDFTRMNGRGSLHLVYERI